MAWELSELSALLDQHAGWNVEQQADSLLITNEDEVTAYLAVGGEQILIEILLFSTSSY